MIFSYLLAGAVGVLFAYVNINFAIAMMNIKTRNRLI